MKPTDQLRQAPVFSHLDDSMLGRLVECATIERRPAAARLYAAGDGSWKPYFLTSGEVRMERETSLGPVVLRHCAAGCLFGEAAFVDRQPRSATAVCAADVELMALDPDGLTALARSQFAFDLAFSWTLWKSLSEKLRGANQRLSSFFEVGDAPPAAPPAPAAVESGGGVRVDLAAKRSLFQEQTLSNLEINFLASLSREERFAPGEVIFREGEDGEKMYVILAGQVMISKYIPGAGEEALAFLGRGDYFGEMALIDGRPRSAEAKAHGEEAVVLALSREVVEGLLDIHKVSSARLLKLLCSLVARRLRESEEKLIGWHLLSGGVLRSSTG